MIRRRAWRLPLRRRIFQYRLVQVVAATIIAAALRLLWRTCSVTRQIHPQAQPYLKGEQAAIFCFWHGRMILLPFFMPKGRDMVVLISQHRDGELIARLIRHFGIHSIRGSTSKGAREATQQLLAALKDGQNIAITPDGPRGPAFTAQRGALHLARLSGCVMLPVSYAASRARILRSWDRFMIPLPFSHIRLEIGAPIAVSRKANLEQLMQSRAVLEQALNAVTCHADEGAQ